MRRGSSTIASAPTDQVDELIQSGRVHLTHRLKHHRQALHDLGVGEEVRRYLPSRRERKIEELEPFARFTFQPECLGIDTEPIIRVRWGEDTTFHLAEVPYVEAVDGAEGSECP